MKIALSAGHYPDRPGACFGAFCEHAEAVKWVLLIDKYLTTSGHEVVIVPADVLREKVQFVNSSRALAAVEIHFNSFRVWEDANKDGVIDDDELHNAGEGSETLYCPYSQKGALLAKNIQNELGSVLSPDRGIKPGWYRMNKNNGPDYFLSKTSCTAVIIEPEFIHRKLKIEKYRDSACKAISEAIIKFKGDVDG